MKSLTKALPPNAKSRIKILRASVALRARSARYADPSLNGIAEKMGRYLPETGTFLEIGANDGYSQSNTYHLEKLRGWTGVLIEPNPRLYSLCASHRRNSRTVRVACGAPDAPPFIHISDEGLTSTVISPRARTSRRILVPTSTLSKVIDDSSINRITFMSMDVEGAELEVLKGLDLSRHCPEYLLIETSDLDGVTEALNGYFDPPIAITHHDYLFIAATNSDSQ